MQPTEPKPTTLTQPIITNELKTQQRYRLDAFNLQSIPPITLPPKEKHITPTLTQVLVQPFFICTICKVSYSSQPTLDDNGKPLIALSAINNQCKCRVPTNTTTQATQTDFTEHLNQTEPTNTPGSSWHTYQQPNYATYPQGQQPYDASHSNYNAGNQQQHWHSVFDDIDLDPFQLFPEFQHADLNNTLTPVDPNLAHPYQPKNKTNIPQQHYNNGNHHSYNNPSQAFDTKTPAQTRL